MRTLRILSFFTLIIILINSCQKEYSLEGGNITLLPGTWEFRDSNIHYRGNMDTGFVETSGTTQTLRLQGTSFDGLEDFEIILNTIDPVFSTKTYKASLGEASFEYTKNGMQIYDANQLLGEFIVTINSINSTTVSGTYTGEAEDSLGVMKTITAGKFITRYDDGNTSTDAIGTLGQTAGVCSPIVSSGTYTVGTALNATNSVKVYVTVTTPGTYNITSNTANGVTFSNSGTFANTGLDSVILVGAGTANVTGNTTYTVTFGASTCTFMINYLAGIPSAEGTLGSTAGACTPSTPAGTYTQGIALTATNTVTVQANVTTAGPYTITTNSVNGVMFSATGTFAATGVQNVILVGTGTPLAAGPQTFTTTWGTSTCTFSLTFLPGIPPPVTDYFPTTTNSFWVYDAGTAQAYHDSSRIIVLPATSTFAGNVYNQFRYDSLGATAVPQDTFFYRKTANNYFQYFDVSIIYGFDSPQFVDLNFLRDNVAVNTTWSTPTFSGTSSGTPISGSIKYTILATGVAATVGTSNFADVIKVKEEYFISTLAGIAALTEERWYARGVGYIYSNLTSVIGIADANSIKRYQVF